MAVLDFKQFSLFVLADCELSTKGVWQRDYLWSLRSRMCFNACCKIVSCMFQFKKSPPKIPYKAIALAVFLFLIGSLLIIFGALLLSGTIKVEVSLGSWRDNVCLNGKLSILSIVDILYFLKNVSSNCDIVSCVGKKLIVKHVTSW